MTPFVNIVCKTTLLLALGLGLPVAPAAAQRATEPPTAPLPRLETVMHSAPVFQVATNAEGRWAVTVSDDKTARVWDVASGQLRGVLRPPQDDASDGRLRAVALSPDGALVAVGGHTGQTWDASASVYLFDRDSGRLRSRLSGLPSTVLDLAFSPDGAWLAASLQLGQGVRLFNLQRGLQTASDADCGGGHLARSVQFSPDGRRLLLSCDDGLLRLYAVADGGLGPPQRLRVDGGGPPASARFSPDGQRIAVGFVDSPQLLVLDAQRFEVLARPSVEGVGNGDLSAVAWTADGRTLAAAGRWQQAGRYTLRRWAVDDWQRYTDLPLAARYVSDLTALPDGGLLFASLDASWGALRADGRWRYRQSAVLADLRGPGHLQLSDDAALVGFRYQPQDAPGSAFDLRRLRLVATPAGLGAARTTAPGLDVQRWHNQADPALNGQPIPLSDNEQALSLAISADAQRLVLGTSWALRLLDRRGQLVWRQRASSFAQAVNLSRDGRWVVAGHADGTIRWRRVADGAEVLALFLHNDRRRWIAWTPEGFYASSGEDAEALLGYHLNRGKDHEGEFIQARQLRERYYQPALIARRLDAGGDQALAAALRQRGDLRQWLGEASAAPPALQLQSPAEVASDGEVPVKVSVQDRGGGIGRLIWRIDGIEFEGRMAGVAADGGESRSFNLPPGRRSITVTATNRRGVESLPVRVEADIRPSTRAAPALHVLAVGISQYRDAELRRGVRFAAQDAEAIAQLLGERGAALYPQVHRQVLTDGQATGDAIRAALADVAARAAPQDVFVLYLAGHGASFDGQYHFVPADAVYTSTDALRQRSLTHDQLRSLLAQVTAGRTLILLDTCSAGGFARQDSRGIGDKGAIDQLSRLTGRAVIAATGDAQMAVEGEGGHGAFTYTLLQGLRGDADRNGNGQVDVRELADLVEELLPRLTRRRGFEQFPFSATEGPSFPLVKTR